MLGLGREKLDESKLRSCSTGVPEIPLRGFAELYAESSNSLIMQKKNTTTTTMTNKRRDEGSQTYQFCPTDEMDLFAKNSTYVRREMC